MEASTKGRRQKMRPLSSKFKLLRSGKVPSLRNRGKKQKDELLGDVFGGDPVHYIGKLYQRDGIRRFLDNTRTDFWAGNAIPRIQKSDKTTCKRDIDCKDGCTYVLKRYPVCEPRPSSKECSSAPMKTTAQQVWNAPRIATTCTRPGWA